MLPAMRFRVGASLLLVGVLVGVLGSALYRWRPAAVTVTVTPLANTEWRLVALGNADAPAEVGEGNPTAEFTTATDMTGWTGCNAYAAKYSARESELRLDDLTWTEAGCPSQALFRQEQRIQDSLATVARFEVLGEHLTLHSEGEQVLVFERVGK